MDNKARHTKISKILESMPGRHFMEQLSLLEYATRNSIQGAQLAYVPATANMELPNIYLRTKHNLKIERFLSRNKDDGHPFQLPPKAVEFLDEIELYSPVSSNSPLNASDELLEKLIRQQYSRQRT